MFRMSAKVVLCNSVILDMFLSHDASVLVVNALVSSRLDYCNSLLRSLSKFNLRKLQCIQNSAARIISNTSRYTSITPVLKKLHWLPVEHCSVFKTATLVYTFFHTGFPVSLPTVIPTVPGAVRVVEISLLFPSFNPQSINLSNSLVIILLLMLLVFRMLFLRRFVCPPLSPPSENTSKPTFIPRHTLLSLTYPWGSPWFSISFLSMIIEIVDWFCFVAPQGLL